MASQRPHKISCAYPDCKELATAREPMIQRENGTREIHFECTKGHAFHTEASLTRTLPCDCEKSAGKIFHMRGVTHRSA
jgi:hypothetical protein